MKWYNAGMVGVAVLVLAACADSPTGTQANAKRGISPVANVVPGSGVIDQSNGLVPTNCVAEEWHWVINGLASANLAPSYIVAHFSTGDVQVPFDKFTGGVAHYAWANNLTDVLVAPGATATLAAGTFYIRFNLSHGPCDGPPPPPAALLTVLKFYDANTNGVRDGSEVLLERWNFALTPPTGPVEQLQTTYVQERALGLYAANEADPIETNWKHTTSTVANFELTVDGYTVSFGNVCLGAGGGLTLGFWSNKNGETKIGDNGSAGPELALLSSLNLRNANGANFDPANYTSFRTWILGATATNMANMLSAQLAAMELNVEGGYVTGNSLVFVGGSYGFMTITALMTAANTSLGLYGSTLSGHPQRTDQETLKNALDKANNNLNFVQADASTCPYTFATN